MGSTITEEQIESTALQWLSEVGWQVLPGHCLAPGALGAERTKLSQVILEERLRNVLEDLNPELPFAACEDAVRQVLRPSAMDLIGQNRITHEKFVNGVAVEQHLDGGRKKWTHAKLIDFSHCNKNDWLAVNQFSIKNGNRMRRPDIVLFLNGLPIVVIELKNISSTNAPIRFAVNQLRTYQTELPSLFLPNACLVVSDGLDARIGTIGSSQELFKPWRSVSGELEDSESKTELKVLIKEVLEPNRMLNIMRDFFVFEDGVSHVAKKMAGYHQYHAVQKAVKETLRAAMCISEDEEVELQEKADDSSSSTTAIGDRRIGVVWHTQGSGKSLTMLFYAGRIIRERTMKNPTIVVLTDRNDLDNQLFGTFSRCKALLRQDPVQAESRAHLQQLLSVKSGGVVFTTIQKFLPDFGGTPMGSLSIRRNIVVIADEAHRSQYDFIDGYARYMRDSLPQASFIGFTGTPIEKQDASTRAVFGEYLSIYDIKDSIRDGTTVPIYYESRLAKLNLDENERPRIDPDFEDVTEGEEVERKERLKSKWAQLEALVGSEKRIQLVARDIVKHFTQRLEVMTGKAMIVCMSRRIAVDLYDALIKLRPDWRSDDDASGMLKVIMTGSASDPIEWQKHIRSKNKRERLASRFRDPNDHFAIVIVRDMWLTGFDAPSLHTMYIDKPMRSHGLMQTIARVNRVYLEKKGGLIVDYLGISQELKHALATYTASGGKGPTVSDQEEAVALMMDKYEVCCAILHGFSWKNWATGSTEERLQLLPSAQEYILAQTNGKERFVSTVRELTKAFALAVPHEEAIRIRDDVGFFQNVGKVLSRNAHGVESPEEDLDQAVKQIISRAIIPGGVLDVFAAAGIDKPDISILSDEFLEDVRDLQYKNLAVELLQKLLKGEIRKRGRRNVVQERSFSEMLAETLRRYQSRTIDAAHVIDQLIELARKLRAAVSRGEHLGLNEDELAFYDALETNDSAVKVLGDVTLRKIACELVNTVRKNVKIDWTMRENVQAQLRVLVKSTLRKYNYPPDKEEKATRIVLEQAALFSSDWMDA